MRIGIVGAGALGGLYGALLTRKGYDVHFLMRRDYEAVRRNGLTVRSYKGDFHLERVKCYRNVNEMGPMDLVFVGLKTTANDKYEELISPLMSADSVVLSAQNGLGNEERLAELFGPQRVAGGMAFLCSNRLEEGVINHLDYGHIYIGNFQRPPDAKLKLFAHMMQESSVECEVIVDLALGRWEKLIWNVPFNGLSTLLDKSVDLIIGDTRLRAQAQQLMREVQAAARACDVVIEDDILELMMSYTERMKPYYTSMHLDRRSGQPMEVEAIIGEPLRRGRQRGIPLPEMEQLYEQLRILDEANRE